MNSDMHHAYLVSGTKESLLEHLGALASGADFWYEKFATFGVDESRALKERAGRKSASADAKKIFVISADSFTVESQNALLKLFEDPVSDTHFFLLTPFAPYLLPTLRSRLAELNLLATDGLEKEGSGKGKIENKLAKEFLQKKLAERIAFATKIAKEDDGKMQAIEIIEGITAHIRAKNTIPTKEDAKILTQLLQYRDSLSARSPSVKMILETAALTF
ncbi:hypothetical protein L0Y69_03200 [bacterium]|nr:hypothetical protein [bacterium]